MLKIHKCIQKWPAKDCISILTLEARKWKKLSNKNSNIIVSWAFQKLKIYQISTYWWVCSRNITLFWVNSLQIISTQTNFSKYSKFSLTPKFQRNIQVSPSDGNISFSWRSSPLKMSKKWSSYQTAIKFSEILQKGTSIWKTKTTLEMS